MSHRLPPHLAWPLKASQIESALGARAQDVEVVRTTWEKQPSDTPLSVDWHATRGEMQGWRAGEGPTIWLRPVARADRAAVSEVLLRQGLPDLLKWLDRAYAAPATWQAMRHQRRWRPQGAGLAVAEIDGLVHILDGERGGRHPALTWTPLTEA